MVGGDSVLLGGVVVLQSAGKLDQWGAEMKIYKYILDKDTVIEMPLGSRVLTVQIQHEKPCLWAMVNPDEPKTEKRNFVFYPTGGNIPSFVSTLGNYIGTVQFNDGMLIYHLFELLIGEPQ